MKDNSVTVAKGIAIILMVMGHSGCPENLNNFFALFHMPLFFIMSGYCFKDKYLDDFVPWAKRRLHGIYWPYVKWSVFFLLIHNVLWYFHIISDYSTIGDYTDHYYQINEIGKKLIGITVFMKSHDLLVGGFWFLNSLFWGSFIFYAAKKWIVKPMYVISLLLLMSIVVSSVPYYLPFSSRNIVAAIFIFIGSEVKRFEWDFFRKSWLCLIILIVIFVISIFWHTSMTNMNVLEIIPYVIVSTLGTLAVLGLSHYVNPYGGG